jgi:hypothetical protein
MGSDASCKTDAAPSGCRERLRVSPGRGVRGSPRAYCVYLARAAVGLQRHLCEPVDAKDARSPRLRSITRPVTYGPRSLIRTVTERPLLLLVTLTLLPIGSDLWRLSWRWRPCVHRSR